MKATLYCFSPVPFLQAREYKESKEESPLERGTASAGGV